MPVCESERFIAYPIPETTDRSGPLSLFQFTPYTLHTNDPITNSSPSGPVLPCKGHRHSSIHQFHCRGGGGRQELLREQEREGAKMGTITHEAINSMPSYEYVSPNTPNQCSSGLYQEGVHKLTVPLK